MDLTIFKHVKPPYGIPSDNARQFYYFVQSTSKHRTFPFTAEEVLHWKLAGHINPDLLPPNHLYWTQKSDDHFKLRAEVLKQKGKPE